jgi:hypothetical protein
MCKSKLIAALSSLLVLAGCLPLSVHPLYTDKTDVEASELVGEWVQKDGSKLTIEPRQGEKGYVVRWRPHDGQPSAEFEAHLVRLGGRLFWDLYPAEPPEDKSENELYSYQRFPLHSIARIAVKDDSLEVRFLKDEWLERLAKEGKLQIRHERLDEALFILTASPEDLQGFLTPYASEGEAFDEAHFFLRGK